MLSRKHQRDSDGWKTLTSASQEVATIEVRLRDLAQLFNSMDPSPFLEKELDSEAEEWIVSSAKEAPAEVPLRLVVHLEQPGGAKGEVEVVQSAVHTFFLRKVEMSQRELRERLRIGRKSLLIGVTIVAATVGIGDLIEEMLPHSRLAQILRESLLIGGWVAMWRPMEIFLYDWWPIRNKRRTYERLGAMDVEISYCGTRCEHQLAAM